MSGLAPLPGLSFTLLNAPTTRFGPRLGNVILNRTEKPDIHIPTPNFLTTTSRGVIPHLSRDHYTSGSIRWVNILFESFLDIPPPVPTLVAGEHPLHTFLGFSLGQHIVSMSLRDPLDIREMPPNGNAHVSAYSLQGVRKVSPAQWKSFVYACKPDVVFALADTPFTNPPYSQKRLTKSIERSASWLANILTPPAASEDHYRPSVLVQMAGATSIPARRVFAESLVEKLHGPEAEAVKPLRTLDEGVFGYTFDLAPIRVSLKAGGQTRPSSDESSVLATTAAYGIQDATTDHSPPKPDLHPDPVSPLLHASLECLPTVKLRLVNTVQTPHEILLLISSVGIDLFDAHWAQYAANMGVALDFTFPAPDLSSLSKLASAPKKRDGRKFDIGHNLYHEAYTYDYSPFGSLGGERCTCFACSPISPLTRIYHGTDDSDYTGERLPTAPRTKPSFTRAYAYHLLQTHEMSAHALLVMHNLAVLDRFFGGIRKVLSSGSESEWKEEVKRFGEVYDEGLRVIEEARVMWRDVDLARGKGRLGREKAKLAKEGT